MRRLESEKDAGESPLALRSRLYQTEADFVWRAMRRLGAPPEQMEDLTHDVFEKAFESLSTYDPSRPLRPWLFGIAFRVVSDYRRLAVHRFERSGPTPEFSDGSPAPEEIVAGEQQRRLLHSALDGLDPDKRAILVMYYLESWTIRDIAEVFPAPTNTLYSRLRLAREDLLRSLQRLGI